MKEGERIAPHPDRGKERGGKREEKFSERPAATEVIESGAGRGMAGAEIQALFRAKELKDNGI